MAIISCNSNCDMLGVYPTHQQSIIDSMIPYLQLSSTTGNELVRFSGRIISSIGKIAAMVTSLSGVFAHTHSSRVLIRLISKLKLYSEL